MHKHCDVCGGQSSLNFLKRENKKVRYMTRMTRNNAMNIGTMVLPVLLWTGSCATVGHDVGQKSRVEERSRIEERTVAHLEAMTAAGEFSTVAQYVNHYFQEHPNAYMNEKYALGETLVQQMPNAIYTIAIDRYAEDVRENMEMRMYVMQQMQERGGFSFNYDLNYDE